MTLRVTYDPKSPLAVADGAAVGVAKALVNEHNRYYSSTEYSATYSTWNVLQQLRILNVQDKIKGPLLFVYKGEVLPVNDDGTLNHWPHGMDLQMQGLEDLFDAQEERLKK